MSASAYELAARASVEKPPSVKVIFAEDVLAAKAAYLVAVVFAFVPAPCALIGGRYLFSLEYHGWSPTRMASLSVIIL